LARQLPLSLELKQGLRLKYGAVFGKGMERLNEQALRACFNGYMADGRKGESLMGPKVVE
jgi:hypothetical protein